MLREILKINGNNENKVMQIAINVWIKVNLKIPNAMIKVAIPQATFTP